MIHPLPTPGQTVGPFFRYGVEFDRWDELVPPRSAGSIRVFGVVRDGDGNPVPDAMLEIWQADRAGSVPAEPGSLNRDGATFTGWGRTHTTDEGGYEFVTVEPSAPFIALAVFARGLMDVLHTRIYLPEATDSFLESLTPGERATVVAERTSRGLRLDIRLQGEGETVFLAYR